MKWLILLIAVTVVTGLYFLYSRRREDMSNEEKRKFCEKMRSTFKIKTGISWGTAPKDVQLEYLKLNCEDNAPVAYDPGEPYPSYGSRKFSMRGAKNIGGDPELVLGG